MVLLQHDLEQPFKMGKLRCGEKPGLAQGHPAGSLLTAYPSARLVHTPSRVQQTGEARECSARTMQQLAGQFQGRVVGLGGRQGEPDVPTEAPAPPAPLGQHTCFLSSEDTGFQPSPPGRGITSHIYVPSEINARETFKHGVAARTGRPDVRPW